MLLYFSYSSESFHIQGFYSILQKKKKPMRCACVYFLNRVVQVMAAMGSCACEPARKSAYSNDLRWRMVWQLEVLGYKLKRVASNLCVDMSTVHRITQQFKTTGTVDKKQYTARTPIKLTKPVQFTVLHLILQKPGIYLWEIQQELAWLFGLDISAPSLCNFLKKNNFSRKKMQLVASQRNQELRSVFVSDVSAYDCKSLVFIDETGCDRRDAIRKYGYGLRGKPVKCQKLLVRGERISVIAAMTVEGVTDLKIVRGGVTGDIFNDFVEKQLLPQLMTFNGSNPNSVIILDNCSIHHVPNVASTFRDVGVLVHYLPPYSPDYNPIELLFSKVKAVIRQMELEFSVTKDIDTIVLAAFSTITREDCEAWVYNSTLYS